VNGGSGYFDGSGDYLSLTNATALQLTNSTAFTIECWVYWLATSGSPFLISAYNTSSGFQGFAIRVLSTSNVYEFWDGTNWNSFGVAPIIGAWTHIAVAYEGSGTTRRFFINGAQVGSAGTVPASINYTSGTITIGSVGATNNANAYISDFRILKGTGPSSVSIPTAPLTNVTNTSLLCNFTNAGIFDNTGKNVLETVGNAQIDTTTKKFGTGSMEFDGTGDYLIGPSNVDFAFGTGDFTIEGWVYITTGSKTQVIIDFRNTGPSLNGLALAIDTANKPYVFVNAAILFTSSVALSLNNWTYIACVKSSGTITLYLDGTSRGSASSATNLTNSALTIGTAIDYRNSTSDLKLVGFIDDLRITKGVARYTANFTAPTKAFQDQ
jgi:hypothetical protein